MLGTSAVKLVCASRPRVSVAVTVTVVTPRARPRMVRIDLRSRTVATVRSELVMAKVSGPPSGSTKWSARSIRVRRRGRMRWFGIGAARRGGRFGTVTGNCWEAARPSGSVAVTVMVAMPMATPVTVIVSPAASTAATAVSEETGV